jgi:hypothetical protein
MHLTIYYAVHALHQEGTHSLYNFVTDNFKEYDLDTEYCLKIDKYLVCEGRGQVPLYFLYWYFQQNQCLNIKNHAIYTTYMYID